MPLALPGATLAGAMLPDSLVAKIAAAGKRKMERCLARGAVRSGVVRVGSRDQLRWS